MTSGFVQPSTQALPPSSKGAAWWLAVRPKTLPAAVIPILVGAACAHSIGSFNWVTTSTALGCALLLQVGSNFANDVFDFEKGADEERVGPARAVAQGWIKPHAMKRAMWLVLTLALLLGLYLTAVGGWVFLLLGLAAIASAVAYTGGPYPLGYNGLGDVFVFVFFGFVAVCGTGFLNAGSVPDLAWWLAVPMGALTTAILVVNNVRDHETDLRVGKRTLVVRLGRRAGIAQYAALLGLAYAVPLMLLAAGRANGWILLPWLTLPLAIKRAHELSTRSGASLNRTLAGTAQLLVIFGLLVSGALMIGSASD